MPDVAKIEASGGPRTMAPGPLRAPCITPGPHQVPYSPVAYPGRVYKLSLDGKAARVPCVSGKQLKQPGGIHEIARLTKSALYVAELLSRRVRKLILHPR